MKRLSPLLLMLPLLAGCPGGEPPATAPTRTTPPAAAQYSPNLGLDFEHLGPGSTVIYAEIASVTNGWNNSDVKFEITGPGVTGSRTRQEKLVASVPTEVTFTISKVGSYTVTVLVTNSLGHTSVDTETIVVK